MDFYENEADDFVTFVRITKKKKAWRPTNEIVENQYQKQTPGSIHTVESYHYYMDKNQRKNELKSDSEKTRPTIVLESPTDENRYATKVLLTTTTQKFYRDKNYYFELGIEDGFKFPCWAILDEPNDIHPKYLTPKNRSLSAERFSELKAAYNGTRT